MSFLIVSKRLESIASLQESKSKFSDSAALCSAIYTFMLRLWLSDCENGFSTTSPFLSHSKISMSFFLNSLGNLPEESTVDTISSKVLSLGVRSFETQLAAFDSTVLKKEDTSVFLPLPRMKPHKSKK